MISVKGGFHTLMRYLCEFCIVNYHLTLDSDPFPCSVKGPKRREDRVFQFFHYEMISVGGGFHTLMRYLCEFCIVKYHLTLDLY